MEKDCPFCMIIRKEKLADFVYEDESLVVIKDIRPHAPVHLLIIPKRHIRSINDLTEEDKDIVFDMILRARAVAREQSIAQSGYKNWSLIPSEEGDRLFFTSIFTSWADCD